MIFSKFDKNIIFIIGSGRTGTHLIGRTLASSPEVDGFIEDGRFFTPITEMAVGLKNKKEFPKVLRKYKKEFSKSSKSYILEKTHPNIWFVEEIKNYFPRAKFIGIKRNVYSTIASMLNHGGVLSWYDKIDLTKENPFFGITEENKNIFQNLPLESKCALRWRAHENRLNELELKFPEDVLVFHYEEFYEDKGMLMLKLKKFLKINFEIEVEKLNVQGKTKWEDILSDEQIQNIKNIIE